MKLSNKILSLFLSVIMIFSLVPITASAAANGGTCGDDVKWGFSSGTGTLYISGTGEMYEYPYRESPWRHLENKITAVEVSGTVSSISRYAFVDFDEIQAVTISNASVVVEEGAFDDCDALRRVYIGSRGGTGGVICDRAFAFCSSLRTVRLYNGVEIIEGFAFYCSNNLKDLFLPMGIKTLERAFCQDSDVKITYDGTSAEWGNVVENNPDALLNLFIVQCKDEKLLPHGSCGDNLKWTVDFDTETLTISGHGEMRDYEGDYYGTYAPWGRVSSHITNVVIEEGVTSIGDYAFYGLGITNITIPNSVSKIGHGALYNCQNLSSITIPNGVRIIGRDFVSVSTEIVFQGDSNLWLSIVKNNGDSELRKYLVRCWDKTLWSVGSCGENVTYEMNLMTNCMTISGTGAMKNYSAGLGFRGVWTDFIDEIHSVVIEDGVETIGEYAFSCCSNLTSVTIPASVTKICSSAFAGCKNLSDVYYAGNEYMWNKVLIDNLNGGNKSFLNAKIHYDCRKVVTPPTCTEAGYVTYTCSCCDDGYLFGYIEPTGHIYTETQILPTCTAHGYIQYTCESCGFVSTDYTSNPTGHTFNDDGVCEVCGEKEASTNHINFQMLSIESVFAMIMNLLAKLFGIFTVA